MWLFYVSDVWLVCTGVLQSERSGREIEKIELHAIRDDNDRLRDQLSALRKRASMSSNAETATRCVFHVDAEIE